MLQSRRVRCALLGACLALLIPTTALAQEGTIAGTIRDEQSAVLPGVTVEATSPALIGVRTTISDDRGQYRITNLPVGAYTVVFGLSGFQRQQRDNIVLTSGFTANVSPVLGVGSLQETLTVTAETPVIDVQNARQAITFSGEQLQELPTSRNIVSLLALTPGIGSSYRPGTAYGICNGGVGTFCGPAVQGFDQGEELGGSLLTSQGPRPPRVTALPLRFARYWRCRIQPAGPTSTKWGIARNGRNAVVSLSRFCSGTVADTPTGCGPACNPMESIVAAMTTSTASVVPRDSARFGARGIRDV